MKVLVTGGCGYKGSVLVPMLLEAGHHVEVVDLQWFGNHLREHPNLKVRKEDFRMLKAIDAEAVIHLAGIANDPAGERNPALTWEVNALGTMQLGKAAVASKVEQFIYASSGSIYGVSNEPKVDEDSPLVPLTAYNKSKAVAEECLYAFADAMSIQIVRPGTVIGYSPRQRLDITLNGMVVQALTNATIQTDAGGKRVRPYTHIKDICAVYLWLLDRPHRTGTWNAGFENIEAVEVANLIKSRLTCKVVEKASNDPRNYRMDSTKILKAGFVPQYDVRDAIDDLISHYAAGILKDEDRHYNLRVMPHDC